MTDFSDPEEYIKSYETAQLSGHENRSFLLKNRLLQRHHEKNILLGNTQAGLHFEYVAAVMEKNSLILSMSVVYCFTCTAGDVKEMVSKSISIQKFYSHTP